MPDGLQALIVAAAFAFAFVVLPSLVIPRPADVTNRLDRIVANFLRCLAIVLVATHVLVYLKLYEFVTIFAAIALGAYYVHLRPRGYLVSSAFPIVHRAMVGALDAIEGNGRWSFAGRRVSGERGELVLPAFRFSGTTFDRAALAAWKERGFTLLLVAPILVVFAGAIWARLAPVLSTDAMVVPDAYVHMTWAKELQANVLWPDGIYPMGMASIIAFVSKFSFFVDTADATRMMGFLTGSLTVFGLYYAVLKLTRNPGAALIAAGTFGLFGTRPEWHELFVRQLAPLPQEFALGVALLAFPFGAMAVRQRSKSHLITLLCAGASLSFFHPIAIPLFGLATAAVAFITALGARRGFRWFTAVCGACIAGILIGASYLPIALLTGHETYEGLTNFNPVAQPAEQEALKHAIEHGQLDPDEEVLFAGHNELTKYAGWGTALATAAAIVLAVRKRTRTRGLALLSLAVVAGGALLLYDVKALPFDAFYSKRLANTAGPWVALAFGCGVAAIAAFLPKRRPRVSLAISLALGILGIAAFGSRFPNVDAPITYIEYETTADITTQIKSTNSRFTYTLVGVYEQRQRALGSAFFVDLWVFARDIRMRDAFDPGHDIPIPTERVFIYVEKIPYPVAPLPPANASEEYYRDQAKRGRIMAKVYRWAETYRRFHSDMSIYYDDPEVRVYVIERTPNIREADRSPRFKDYTWRAGELFNEGPTEPLEVWIP